MFIYITRRHVGSQIMRPEIYWDLAARWHCVTKLSYGSRFGVLFLVLNWQFCIINIRNHSLLQEKYINVVLLFSS